MPAKKRSNTEADATNRTGYRRAQVADDETDAEVAGLLGDKPKAGRSRAKVPRSGVASHQKADPDEEPDTRPNITLRLGKRWSQIITEVADGQYTWEEFTEELDPEELVRGQLKDRHGRFTGRPNVLVPHAFHNACIREIQRRFNEKVQGRLLSAVDELIDLSKAQGGLDGKDRAKLLVYLVERVMGPVPKTVNVTTNEPWQGLATQGLFRPTVDGQPAKPPAGKDRYAKRRRAIDPAEDVDD